MLENKVAQLERDVVTAERIASFWRKQIVQYGEPKAEAFYRSLGLNHLETKSVEWEGLVLSRQPTEIEKTCVKGIAQAQDSGKESIKSILLRARAEMVDVALAAIRKLTPATYHELVLTMPAEIHSELRDQVSKVFNRGRRLVAQELSKTKQDDFEDDDEEELDDLTELTDSRLANDVQSRVTAAVTRFTLLGLTGAALWTAVRGELDAGTVGYIDRASTGLANRVLNFGRMREAETRNDEWGRVEYSALLDANVCGPCASEDGQSSEDESDLTPVPNPECEGGDWCRCFHVFVAEGTM